MNNIFSFKTVDNKVIYCKIIFSFYSDAYNRTYVCGIPLRGQNAVSTRVFGFKKSDGSIGILSPYDGNEEFQMCVESYENYSKENGNDFVIDHIDDIVIEKKLTRTTDNMMISGVCGGLAKYFNMDVSIMRIIFVLVTLFTAILPCVLAYFIMAIILPKD